MFQGAFIQNIERFDVFVCVKCLKKELGLQEYGITKDKDEEDVL